MQGEAAEAADLDPLAGGQGLSHLLKHGLDGQLDILGRKQPLLVTIRSINSDLVMVFPSFSSG